MELNDLDKSPIEGEDSNSDIRISDSVETEQNLLPDSVEVTNELQTDDLDYDKMNRETLLEKFKDYLQNYSSGEAKKHLEAIKEAFENATMTEEENIHHQYIDPEEQDENFSPPLDPLQKRFSELLNEYRIKKDQERELLEEEKERNLKAKYEVIDRIKDLVNRQESLNNTFQEFRELQQRWREIGPVPQLKLHDLWETYHLHVENFYNYIKINNELRDLDLKRNYEAKIVLCEKAEKLLLEPSTRKAFKMLQKFHDQWREIGPAPRDKKEEIWDRFKAVTNIINQKQQEFLITVRERQKKNLEAKIELCEKIEALAESESHSPRKWEDKSKQLIEFQAVWKTIGFGPKKVNNKVYSRFRKACNNFYNKKREFYKTHKDEQSNNLQLKTELCIQAEAIKDSTEWRKTTDEFILLQKKWKELGKIYKKQGNDVWKRFTEACDYFFERKNNFYNNIDKEQGDNLKKKEEIISKVKNYKVSEDGEKSFAELQEFQRQWAEIGYVPIKAKERLAGEFRFLINKQFDKLNLDEGNKDLQKLKNKIENWKSTKQFNEKVVQERNRILLKLKQLESEIIIWENNIGFFTKSKNSEALVREFTNKIESGKLNIKSLNEKLNMIEGML